MVSTSPSLRRYLPLIMILYLALLFPLSYLLPTINQEQTTTTIPEQPKPLSRLETTKLFQHALHPFQLTPFQHRGKREVKEEELTLTTMITIDRLETLLTLFHKWKGPISATLHVASLSANHLITTLATLNNFLAQHQDLSSHLDIHLTISPYDRQFNLWRNIARYYARSDYILMIDVDFMPTDIYTKWMRTKQWRQIVSGKGRAINGQKPGKKCGLVVPAFEYAPAELTASKRKKTPGKIEVKSRMVKKDEMPEKHSHMPESKAQLLPLLSTGEVLMFHGKWKRGHAPTDYDRWVSTDKMYKVEEYNFNYEPYVIMAKEGAPWCDERFTGYGSNKAACYFEFIMAGYELWTLPNDFLIHQMHMYPEEDRRKERRNNRRLYDSFREEMCWKYKLMGQGIANGTIVDERLCGSAFRAYLET